jgi:hypothetical protein
VPARSGEKNQAQDYTLTIAMEMPPFSPSNKLMLSNEKEKTPSLLLFGKDVQL